MWYQKYAPNPAGSTEEVNVDCQEDMEGNEYCYLAAKDNTSVYVAAANLAELDGETTADIYNNIYLIGYNQGSNQNTLNIFSQLINNLKFNYNIDNSQLNKSEMIRDYVRIQDNVRIRKYIKQYGYEHNGAVPQLQAGTYDRQRTFSVWPSWQEELGVQLGLNMPKDPLNHFNWEQAVVSDGYTGPDCMKPNAVTEDIYHCLDDEYQCIIPMEKCVHCPEGYDSQTCYNSEEKDFFNYYDDNPDEHPVYMYRADPYGLGNTSVYELDFMQEVSDKNYMVTPEFVSYD